MYFMFLHIWLLGVPKSKGVHTHAATLLLRDTPNIYTAAAAGQRTMHMI